MKMTHKERAVAALNRRQPDFVPTFELEFQLEEEMFGRKFITDELLPSRLAVMSETEKRRAQRPARAYSSHALSYASPAAGPSDVNFLTVIFSLAPLATVNSFGSTSSYASTDGSAFSSGRGLEHWTS